MKVSKVFLFIALIFSSLDENKENRFLRCDDDEINCSICINKGNVDIYDNESAIIKVLLVNPENSVLLRESESNGFIFYQQVSKVSIDEVEDLLEKSREIISNIINHYHLDVSKNGINKETFSKTLLKIFEDKYRDSVTVKFDGQKSELFFNIVFITLYYIKEVVNEVRKSDVEQKAMFNFQYRSINEILNYLTEIFCDPNVILRDQGKGNYYILLSRLFLKRLLGLSEFKEETYKCKLKNFLFKNIENSKVFSFYKKFPLKQLQNDEISCDLVERVLQAIDLHYF